MSVLLLQREGVRDMDCPTDQYFMGEAGSAHRETE